MQTIMTIRTMMREVTVVGSLTPQDQAETITSTTETVANWGWSGTRGERRWNTSWKWKGRDEVFGFQRERNKVRKYIMKYLKYWLIRLIRNNVGSSLQPIYRHRSSDESGWKSSRVDILRNAAKKSNLYHYSHPQAASVVTRRKY